MEKYVLGVDIGSGSVKLTLLSQKGKIAATAGCEYETIYPQVGWSEQNPDDWCKAFEAHLLKLKRLPEYRQIRSRHCLWMRQHIQQFFG